MNSVDRIRDAVSFVPPDDRETWLKMGMAIKSEIGDSGFEVWDAWSQQADSYDTRDARDVWRSIRANGKVTAGTLFHEAKANGWRDDRIRHKPTIEELAERKRIAEERARQEDTVIDRKLERGHRMPSSIPPNAPTKSPPKPNTYFLDLWNAAHDQLVPFSKPYTSDPDHLVSEHPYAKLKKVRHPAGARRGIASGSLIGKDTDCIIVPSYDLDQRLVGVECIGIPDPVTRKTPKQSFGKKGVLILGNDRDAEIPILMCEGWASVVAWVFNMNKGNACGAVFFGKSSGKRIQAELQKHYPKHVVLLGVEQDG